MNTRSKTTAVAATAALALAACSSGTSAGGSGEPLVDGTLKLALQADPGSLFPHTTADSYSRQVIAFGYESLVTIAPEGEVRPWLAEKWETSTTATTFTVREGVKCADGSPLTAKTVAANFDWLAEPKNGSPLLGVFVPPGLTTTVDEAARTVTLTASGPAPFLLESLGQAFIACDAALKAPTDHAAKFNGTGPYELTEVKAGNSYTLTRREDYAWGPMGTTAKTPGLPKTVVVTVVGDNTTRANLLLSRETNGAGVEGPEAKRVAGADLPSLDFNLPSTAVFLNHAATRPTADPAVRKALVQATNTRAVADILGGGDGGEALSFMAGDPKVCQPGKIHEAAPKYSVDEAKRTLDAAGWTAAGDGTRTKDGRELALVVVVRSDAQRVAGFEYLVKEWQKIGVKATLKTTDPAGASAILFDPVAGDWDVADWGLAAPFPNMLVPFFSGAGPGNFSKIANPAYDEKVAAASGKLGAQGCADWVAAETALVAAADILPIGWTQVSYFYQGFKSDRSLQIEPWSLRQSS
ncbi:ABC transporter substrate-binding protein [Actinosynnema sp. NPDC047251]|uniref:Dipeptide-binding protein n=1 Tax=Saccharothrix espanaensis (strain ATCC 51144 / DSM 44229 / JCM 9112 / NBRC 15066 / NRRL 15764) TaxID=1179773 RepID=K0JRA9_SACES|nr:ABC transporter substrate-binding protein [Saccharothrix espanaensis]CCH30100.1 Dipeptide-binding protein [Saccharothrix espanaensis DSM 44229]